MSFFISLVICLLVVGYLNHRHRRIRLRANWPRRNRRNSQLMRQPLPAPWDGAIANNWTRTAKRAAQVR